MKKKLISSLLALLVVLVVGGVLFTSNLDSIIKSAVEKYGSDATQAETTLSDVEISLSSGKGTLKGFNLGNPEGFTTDSAMAFDKVSVEIDTKSVMGDGPIIVREILIDAPAITYEVTKNGTSNLQKIQENIAAYTSSLRAGEEKQPAEGKTSEEDSQNERKIIIEKLVISNGQVKLSHALLEGKNLVDTKLPTISMSNIGKNDGGMSPARLMQLVLGKITSKAMAIGSSSLVKELGGQGIDALKGAAKESGVGKVFDGLFGK
ncbi:MAG TPA: hypothetical protein DD400_03015 [Rhodospirillaceae bacterium]|nr:hypothetical protein [Rhodospirillaceae bacterium]